MEWDPPSADGVKVLDIVPTYVGTHRLTGDVHTGGMRALRKGDAAQIPRPRLHTGAACMLPVGPVLRHEYRVLFPMNSKIRIPKGKI